MSAPMKSTVIGLSGCSGSGKTMMIREILKNFPAGKICAVTQDNYYLPPDRQSIDQNGVTNFDLPESIDHDRMIGDLHRLLKGEPVSLKEYTYNNPDAGAKTITIHPANVIIVEGIFIYYIPAINRLLDFRLFIEAREHLMLKRRIIRDREERGYDLNDVLYRYENHVIPTFLKYILPYRESCDLIIPNNTAFEGAIKILSGFISGLLGPE